jgi:hypothetical protein
MDHGHGSMTDGEDCVGRGPGFPCRHWSETWEDPAGQGCEWGVRPNGRRVRSCHLEYRGPSDGRKSGALR